IDVKIDGAQQVRLRDFLAGSMRVQNRSWPNQQRFTPIRKIWNVGREARDHSYEPVNVQQSYRIVDRFVGNGRTTIDSFFQPRLDRSRLNRQTNLQGGLGFAGNYVCPRAAADYSDVAGRFAKHLIARPVDGSDIVQHAEQFFDR